MNGVQIHILTIQSNIVFILLHTLINNLHCIYIKNIVLKLLLAII